MRKMNKTDRISLAGLYNAEGKQKLYQVLREQYEIVNPSCTFNSMKKAPYLQYNAEKDRFMVNETEQRESDIFLDIETLCSRKSGKNRSLQATETESAYKSMDTLIQELIGDRLLALSQYVSLDASAKVLRLDETSLKNDGYRLILH